MAGVFAWFPHPVVRRAGRGIGRSLSYVATDRMALLRRHMRRVLGEEPTDEEITAAAREMFASYGRYWAEVFWFRPKRRQWVLEKTEVEGEDPVVAAHAEGRGVVLAVAHLGNWEVAGPVAVSLGFPVVSVAEELPNRRITDWFIETRAEFEIEILVVGRQPILTSLAKAVKAGKSAALVSDRDVTGKGVEVEFFGERTTMPSGPAALAELTGAALFPIGTYFEGDGFRLVAHPELEPDASVEDRQERIHLTTQRLAEVFEEIVRREPTQWHLFQPNWPSDRAWLEEQT
jgi:KDO2-lipid IV(A) lauroyltransferase